MEDKLRWNFQVFLVQIAEKLTEGDLQQMKFVLMGYVTSAKCHDMKALQYIEELQKLLLLTPTKLEIFKYTLRVIGRPDIVEKVEEKEEAFATLPREILEQEEYDAVCVGIEKAVTAGKFTSLPRADLSASQVPVEIVTHCPFLGAYKMALAYGETTLRRVPLMLIGQRGAGLTSTRKSLKGICFYSEQGSTFERDEDPSSFKVSTEIWCPERQDQVWYFDKAFSPDYHLARYMANYLITSGETNQLNTVAEVGSNTFDSKAAQKEEGASGHKELFEESHGFSPSAVPKELKTLTEQFLSTGKVNDNREEIYFTFWDFAGQSVCSATQQLFLTDRAMVLMVYDLSLNPDDDANPVLKQRVYEENEESYNIKTHFDCLTICTKSVASLASGQAEGSRLEQTSSVKLPPVFLVCTHADKPYCHGDPEKLARELFGRLKRTPYGAHLYDVFWIDNTSLTMKNSHCPEVVRLQQEIIAVAKELPFINKTISINWLKFEKALQAKKEVGNKCISLETAKDIAKNECNIVDEKEFENLLNYLHEIRSLIYYEDTVQLNKLVVLDPQWLVDVKPYDPKEEEFLHLWGNQERALAVRSSVFEHLSSKSCDAELVVSKLKETLRLDQASLEQPDSDTKKQIRCLAREASRSNRPDVVEFLREITPAGTTGPLLPESLDVRRIPPSQARQLTIDLTVAYGDKWKFVAEKLGLNPGEIRFLDDRYKNPVEALLAFVPNQRYLSVGELYQVLCDCGIPVIADQL